MKDSHITFEEFLATLRINQHGLEKALKALDSVHWPIPILYSPSGKPDLRLASQIAEGAFKRSALIGRTTSGMTPDQFLMTLAEQNTLNSALALLNIALAESILHSLDSLKQFTALRGFQTGIQPS